MGLEYAAIQVLNGRASLYSDTPAGFAADGREFSIR
jgi:hypothetical protein